MDEYEHLRESAAADWISHLQGIPARDTRDEDRAQEARRGAREIREHAYYDTGFFERNTGGAAAARNRFAPNPYDATHAASVLR